MTRCAVQNDTQNEFLLQEYLHHVFFINSYLFKNCDSDTFEKCHEYFLNNHNIL